MITTTLLVIVIAIIAVAFLVIGLSITLIFKGRHMQTEVGENDEMRKRGLKCAKEQFNREEAELRGEDCDNNVSCGGSCGSCSEHTDKKA